MINLLVRLIESYKYLFVKKKKVLEVRKKEIDVFYCDGCNSVYPCSTQNFGIKCDFEKAFEIKNYGRIIES